ncbi:MAG: hypothetical protein R3A50_01935 [Saprospiraceae bacterium]|nr:hypothetical protein [Saprospiraceae bacterium]MCB9344052.1 hypothetical protein [Lewinellaceae bacterium]
MKKLIIFLLALLSYSQIHAQAEVKISPVALLFEVVAISVETPVADNFGLDGDIITSFYGGFYANLSGKYYFNPKTRIDGFHIGAFLGGGTDTGVGLGFLLGYKLLSRNNVVFEVGAGVGRGIEDSILGYGKLHVGYRFGERKKAEGSM